MTATSLRTGTRRLDERLMVRLACLLTRVFFRHLEVDGAEHLPADRPVVLVANHVNGLVDALVLMALLRRYPRFLAKDTLFKILPLVPFLRLARVIPVHRAKDGAGGADRNASAFRSCREILRRGGFVAVFPEGISHDEPNLQELRTGAARIALDAAGEGAPVVVVAAGLVYDDKARFRSRALVRLGAALPVAGATSGAADVDGADAVRGLTDELAVRLRAVGPDFQSWEDAHRWAAIAGIVADEDPRDGEDLHARDDVARRLAARADVDTEGSAALAQALTRYEEELAGLGLRDEDLRRVVPAGTGTSGDGRARRRTLRSAAVAAPVVAVGTTVHAAPYAVMKQLGRLPRNEGMKATVKVLGCFALFTMVYVTIGVVVGRRAGFLAGLAAFLAGPLSGYVTLRTAERVADAGGVARARRIVRGHDLGTLLAARAAVVEGAQTLLDPPTRAGVA